MQATGPVVTTNKGFKFMSANIHNRFYILKYIIKSEYGIKDISLVPLVSSWTRVLWLSGIFIFSIMYYLIYFQPANLHDCAHYAVSGVSIVRDNKGLLYPYHPHSADGKGPSYEHFQNNSIHFDTRINYPAKLYSAVYGLICLVTGKMRIQYLVYISFSTFLLGNILLFLIGNRFLVGSLLFNFLVMIIFMPIMAITTRQSIDVFTYTGTIVILWMCLCLRFKPLALGIAIGLLINFREQFLTLILVIPIIYSVIDNEPFIRKNIIPLLVGVGISYGTVAILYSQWVGSEISSSSLDFYFSFFKRAAYKEVKYIFKVLDRMSSTIVGFFNQSKMFILPVLLIICALVKERNLSRQLAIASFVFIALPAFWNAMMPYALAPGRYYLGAIPMAAIAWYMFVKHLEQKDMSLKIKTIAFFLSGVIVTVFFNVHGIPVERLNWDNIKERAQYLDFEGVQEALKKNFKDDDVVIINHSLPTGLSRLHNVIYLPKTKKPFIEGDNKKISGLIFVYSNEPPDNFFKPTAWLVNGKLPETITDRKGIVFKTVYKSQTAIKKPDGATERKAIFRIYKNSSLS